MLVAKKYEMQPAFREIIAPKPVMPAPGLKTLQKLVCVALLILVALTSFVIVYRFSEIVRVRREIVQLETELSHARAQQNALALEVAQLKTPDRIRTLAKQELGLILPKESQFVNISNGP